MEGLHLAPLDVNVIFASREWAMMRMLNCQSETCTRACTRSFAIGRIALPYLPMRAPLAWQKRSRSRSTARMSCCPPRCVSTESRFLFSRVLRFFRWNSNVPRLASFSLSLFPLSMLFSHSSPRQLFIFNRPRDPGGNWTNFDTLWTWNAHIFTYTHTAVINSSRALMIMLFKVHGAPKSRLIRLIIMPQQRRLCSSAGACCTRSWRFGRPLSRSHRGTLWLFPGLPRGWSSPRTVPWHHRLSEIQRQRRAASRNPPAP